MFTDNLALQDLINLDNWQMVQDSFAEVLEISLRTVSLDGKTIAKPSRPTRLCDNGLSKIATDQDLCRKCILKNGRKASTLADIREDANLKCPFDVDLYVIPIKAVGNKIVAHMIIGPFILKKRKEMAEYAKDAASLGIDLERLTDALIELNVFSYNKVYSMIKLIKDVFSNMAQTAYHKKRLGEIAPEVIQVDPLFSHYYEEKVLGALLSACTLALDVDSGSVMTVDKKTNMLHIKAATALADDIVNNASIKMGEGIAGLAAAQAKPIILPKDKNIKGVSARMKREYIRSSMIVPFNKANTHEVYGVINLNVTRKHTDFTERDIAIVNELISMASIALIPVKSN